MSALMKDPKALATVVAASLAFLVGLFSLIVNLRTAFRQERLQRDLAEQQATLQRDLTEQQARLQRDIESAKDVLERARSFDTLTRDRIISRFDGALNAYGVLSTYAQLVGRGLWVRQQGAAEIEERVQSESSSLRSGLEFLRFIKAIPEPDYRQCVTACSRVTRAWGRLMGELALGDGENLAKPSGERDVLSGRLSERHTELRALTKELGTALFESLARITVPR
jgi:hypothetical protein